MQQGLNGAGLGHVLIFLVGRRASGLCRHPQSLVIPKGFRGFESHPDTNARFDIVVERAFLHLPSSTTI